MSHSSPGEDEVDEIRREERERTRDIKRIVGEWKCSDICHYPYARNHSQRGVATSIRPERTLHFFVTRRLHLVDTDLRVVHVDDIRIPCVVHVVGEC